MERVLSLSRDDHPLFAKETFSSLLKSRDFADVTLVDEDNIQSTAHKAILSAGSEFFQKLFSSNPHPHPLVYLRIPNNHMLALLNFIYEGKCVVAETEMKDFMEVANDLGIMPEEVEEGEVIVVKKSIEKADGEAPKDGKQSDKVQDSVDQINMSEENTAHPNMILTKTNPDEVEETVEQQPENPAEPAMLPDGVQEIKEEINIDDVKKVKIEEDYAGDDAQGTLCNMCGKRYSRNRDLRRHIRFKHAGVHDDVCPNCGKVLSSKDELKRHMIAIHSERTKEICEICNKEFSRKRDVIEHKRFKHSEDQNDKCDQCEKIFEDKWGMKIHKQSIHEESIFSCDQCTFKTHRKPSMNHHMKSTHQGVRYSCQFGCPDYSVGNKSAYMRHIFAQHDNTE